MAFPIEMLPLALQMSYHDDRDDPTHLHHSDDIELIPSHMLVRNAQRLLANRDSGFPLDLYEVVMPRRPR